MLTSSLTHDYNAKSHIGIIDRSETETINIILFDLDFSKINRDYHPGNSHILCWDKENHLQGALGGDMLVPGKACLVGVNFSDVSLFLQPEPCTKSNPKKQKTTHSCLPKLLGEASRQTQG